MRLQSGGDQPHLFLGLGSFQAPSGCWQNSVPLLLGLRFLPSCRLSAQLLSGVEGYLWFLILSQPSANMAAHFFKFSRRMSLLRKDPIPLFKNVLLIKSGPLKLINRLGMLNSICKILSVSPNTVT